MTSQSTCNLKPLLQTAPPHALHYTRFKQASLLGFSFLFCFDYCLDKTTMEFISLLCSFLRSLQANEPIQLLRRRSKSYDTSYTDVKQYSNMQCNHTGVLPSQEKTFMLLIYFIVHTHRQTDRQRERERERERVKRTKRKSPGLPAKSRGKTDERQRERETERQRGKKKKKAYSTWYSQAVSHPSTNQARPCLASEIGRDRACSGWYGRKRMPRPLKRYFKV